MKQLIVAFEKRLTDAEVDLAIKGMSPRAFQAVTQLLDAFWNQASLNSSGFAVSNNALGMASEQGKCEVLRGFAEHIAEMRG